jgi:hypothetical protein
MDPTYHIVGTNGQTYGPVPLDKLLAWVREGRVVTDTMVFRSDQPNWQPAHQFSEIGLTVPQLPLAAATPVRVVAVGTSPSAASAGTPAPDRSGSASPAPGPVVSAAAQVLEPAIKSGASWFYWIAGLSLLNTIVTFAGSQSGFVIGLGITQVFDHFARGLAEGAEGGGGGAKFVALALDLVAYAALILFGVLATRRRPWAFVTGMLLYALDAGIYVLVQDWLAVGFHGFALFFIFKGFTACREYRRLTAT